MGKRAGFPELPNKNSISYKWLGLMIGAVAAVFVSGLLIINMIMNAYRGYIYEAKTDSLNASIMIMEDKLEKIEDITYTFIGNNNVQDAVTKWLNADKELEKLMQMPEGKQDVQRINEMRRYKTASTLSILEELDLSIFADSSIATGYYISPDGTYYKGYGKGKTKMEEAEVSDLIDAARESEGNLVYYNQNGEYSDNLILVRSLRERKNLSMDYGGVLVFLVDKERLTSFYTSVYRQLIILEDDRRSFYTNVIDEELLSQIKESWTFGERNYGIQKTGEEKYFITQAVSERTGWRYYSVSFYEELFRVLAKTSSLYIAVFVLLVICVLFMSATLSVHMISPIRTLSEQMKKIRVNKEFADNIKHTLPDIERSKRVDEIGELQSQFYEMIAELDQLINENYEQRLMLQNAQLSALRSQLNPHFLYNTLDTIRWLSVSGHYQKIPHIVKALGDILRLSINSTRSKITINEEVSCMRGYISIQKARFGDRLNLEIRMNEELEDYEIPSFSIQSLVDNAVRYALEQTLEPCYIYVTIEEEEKDICVTVEDNGPGLDSEILDKLITGEKIPSGNGTGLLNLDKRLNNLYGEEYGLEIGSSKYGGASIVFRIRKERN